MSFGSKTAISASNFEVESQTPHVNSKLGQLRIAYSVRLALAAIALIAGFAILGVSAQSISIYNATHVPGDYLLPLWPSQIDLRPTVAMIVGGVLVVLASAVSLATSKAPSVRGNVMMNTALMFAAPAVALIAAIICLAFFYGIRASTTIDTFQSWTCRWDKVTMMTQPRFGQLCQEHKAAVGLSVFLVPLEVLALGVAAYQSSLTKQLTMVARGQ